MPTDAKEFINPALHVYAADVRKALRAEEERLADLSRFHADLRQVQQVVSDLPTKLTHQIMVPFGKVAYFPGEIIHSNELLVHLGDKYYANCTSHTALQILARRSVALSQTIKEAEDKIKLYRSRLDAASQTLGEELDENVVDIRETWEESEELLKGGHAVTQPEPSPVAADLSNKDIEDMMRRLEELEQLEAASEVEGGESSSEFAQLPVLPEEGPDSDDEEGWAGAFEPVAIQPKQDAIAGNSHAAQTSRGVELLATSSSSNSIAEAKQNMPSTSRTNTAQLGQQVPASSPIPLKRGFLVSERQPPGTAPSRQVQPGGHHAGATLAQPKSESKQLPAAFTGEVVERQVAALDQPEKAPDVGHDTSGMPTAKVSKFKQQRMFGH